MYRSGNFGQKRAPGSDFIHMGWFVDQGNPALVFLSFGLVSRGVHLAGCCEIFVFSSLDPLQY